MWEYHEIKRTSRGNRGQTQRHPHGLRINKKHNTKAQFFKYDGKSMLLKTFQHFAKTLERSVFLYIFHINVDTHATKSSGKNWRSSEQGKGNKPKIYRIFNKHVTAWWWGDYIRLTRKCFSELNLANIIQTRSIPGRVTRGREGTPILSQS